MNTKIVYKQLFVRSMKSGQPGFNLIELREVKISLPPLSVQEKIAKEVIARRDKAKKLKQETKEIIRRAKEKIEEVFK